MDDFTVESAASLVKAIKAKKISAVEAQADYAKGATQQASVAPIGVCADGLPGAVQIIGPYLEDRTCMDFAGKLGKVFGGFTPPPQ